MVYKNKKIWHSCQAIIDKNIDLKWFDQSTHETSSNKIIIGRLNKAVKWNKWRYYNPQKDQSETNPSRETDMIFEK